MSEETILEHEFFRIHDRRGDVGSPVVGGDVLDRGRDHVGVVICCLNLDGGWRGGGHDGASYFSGTTAVIVDD